jgi:hypothetical protein
MHVVKAQNAMAIAKITIPLFFLSGISMPCCADSAYSAFWNGVGSEVVKQIVQGLLSAKPGVWTPGVPHPTKSNVVAADEVNYWHPADGYVWDNREEMTVRRLSRTDCLRNAALVMIYCDNKAANSDALCNCLEILDLESNRGG